MQTLAQPRQDVIRLWGKQAVRQDKKYRLMKYVLRVDHEGKTALHNVVTGQLVLLTPEEVQQLQTLPAEATETLAPLIEAHDLVPEDYDEHQQVINLRTILRKLIPPAKAITHYTILPTTACNARCYYCFEQGTKTVTMTEEVANETVLFIAKHCGEQKKVRIDWFGGEPTVASNRIDQISRGLQAEGITYDASMTTNGYLFNEEMVQKAKDLWHITDVMISVDGVGETYNKVKAYVNPGEDPYQRVMRNIGLLIGAGIYVKLRMNFDLDNYQEFRQLLKEAAERFGQNPNLSVYVHPVNGSYEDHEGNTNHGTEEWFTEKVVELNDLARQSGQLRPADELPALRYTGCMATTGKALTITPDGSLARCPEQVTGDDITGTLQDGETNEELVNSWKLIADYERCRVCALYPHCQSILRCRVGDNCSYSKELMHLFEPAIINIMTISKKEAIENEVCKAGS